MSASATPAARAAWGIDGGVSFENATSLCEADLAVFWVRTALRDFRHTLVVAGECPKPALRRAATVIPAAAAYQMEVVEPHIRVLRGSTLRADAELVESLRAAEDALLHWCDRLVRVDLIYKPWDRWCAAARLAAEKFDYTGENRQPFRQSGFSDKQIVVLILAYGGGLSERQIGALACVSGPAAHDLLARAAAKIPRLQQHAPQKWHGIKALAGRHETLEWVERWHEMMVAPPGDWVSHWASSRGGWVSQSDWQRVPGQVRAALEDLLGPRGAEGGYSHDAGFVEDLSKKDEELVGVDDVPTNLRGGGKGARDLRAKWDRELPRARLDEPD